MSATDAKQIRGLCDEYNAALPEDVEIEERLSASVQAKGFLTKEELCQLVEWKFAGDGLKLPRLRRTVLAAQGDEIRELSRSGLSQDTKLSELTRVRILDGLPAVGPKVASVILTFRDPARYGVFDFHAWKTLASEGLVKRKHDGSNEEYVNEYLPALRKIATKFGLSVRDVEKAYYWKDAK